MLGFLRHFFKMEAHLVAWFPQARIYLQFNNNICSPKRGKQYCTSAVLGGIQLFGYISDGGNTIYLPGKESGVPSVECGILMKERLVAWFQQE